MDFFAQSFEFAADYRRRRHNYARAEFLHQAVKRDVVMDAVIKHLRVPLGGVTLAKLEPAAKRTALVEHLEYLTRTKTSRWSGVSPADIVAAAIVESKLTAAEKATVFPSVKREADLTGPVVNLLRSKCKSVHEEVPMGTKRADVVGYTPGGLFGSPRVVTVELKNDLAQMSRGLDQMTTYDEFSTAVYLACTPRLAADFLKKHAASPGVRRWEPDALDRKLEKFGFGLLLVEGEEVTEVRSARTSSIDAKRLEQLQANLAK